MSKSFRYVKEFEFPETGGFSASAGRTMVKGYARGGAKEMCGGGKYAKGGAAKSPKVGQGMHRNIGSLGVVNNKNPGETARNTAPSLPGHAMMNKGGVPKKGAYKVGKVMGEYKAGELHSGSKEGPRVKSRKQALAIALSEARAAGKKK